jgi:hypothetical protein
LLPFVTTVIAFCPFDAIVTVLLVVGSILPLSDPLLVHVQLPIHAAAHDPPSALVLPASCALASALVAASPASTPDAGGLSPPSLHAAVASTIQPTMIRFMLVPPR